MSQCSKETPTLICCARLQDLSIHIYTNQTSQNSCTTTLYAHVHLVFSSHIRRTQQVTGFLNRPCKFGPTIEQWRTESSLCQRTFLRGWSTIWRFLSNISQFFRGNFTALDTPGLHDIAIGSHSTKSQFRSSEPICVPLIFHLSISFGEATAHKVGHGVSFLSFGSFASSFLVVSVCDSTWRPGWIKGSD